MIKTLVDIPDHLKLTLVGEKSRDQADPLYRQPWLLFQREDPPLLVFAAKQDLQVLHGSEHWFADGTFKYRPLPNEFSQLYVMHGQVNGERFACVHALTANKLTESYTELFTIVRDAMVNNFGNVGNFVYLHTDFEQASVNGARAAFGLNVSFDMTSLHSIMYTMLCCNRSGITLDHTQRLHLPFYQRSQ